MNTRHIVATLGTSALLVAPQVALGHTTNLSARCVDHRAVAEWSLDQFSGTTKAARLTASVGGVVKFDESVPFTRSLVRSETLLGDPLYGTQTIRVQASAFDDGRSWSGDRSIVVECGTPPVVTPPPPVVLTCADLIARGAGVKWLRARNCVASPKRFLCPPRLVTPAWQVILRERHGVTCPAKPRVPQRRTPAVTG